MGDKRATILCFFAFSWNGGFKLYFSRKVPPFNTPCTSLQFIQRSVLTVHAVQRAVLHKLYPPEDHRGPEQEHDDGDDGTEQDNEPRLRQDIVRVVVIYWIPVWGEERGFSMNAVY